MQVIVHVYTISGRYISVVDVCNANCAKVNPPKGCNSIYVLLV